MNVNRVSTDRTMSRFLTKHWFSSSITRRKTGKRSINSWNRIATEISIRNRKNNINNQKVQIDFVHIL